MCLFKIARLALTDVTRAHLLTEEATSGNPWPPDSPSMREITKASFEVDEFYRIVEILHKRFNWGESVRKLSGRVLKLLEEEDFLIQERIIARNLTRGIQGFGSFSRRSFTMTDESHSDRFNRKQHEPKYSRDGNLSLAGRKREERSKGVERREEADWKGIRRWEEVSQSLISSVL